MRIPPLKKGGQGGFFPIFKCSNSKMLQYDAKLKENSRILRRKQTDCELLLWSKLRRKQIGGIQFYRQKPIGPFIVDFYAPSASLVIELDGSQHFKAYQAAYDARRDAYLQNQGLTVLRFNNAQVLKETTGVLEVIYRMVAVIGVLEASICMRVE